MRDKETVESELRGARAAWNKASIAVTDLERELREHEAVDVVRREVHNVAKEVNAVMCAEYGFADPKWQVEERSMTRSHYESQTRLRATVSTKAYGTVGVEFV